MGEYTGTFLALSEGYSVFLKPLKPGNHTLTYEVSVINPINPVNDYIQKTNYNLNVK